MDIIGQRGDPQIGNLATPVNSSRLSLAFIRNLPAYRRGLSANRRGLEVGMAHGYFLYGPFAILGPLRNTEYASTGGLLSAVAMISILTIALSLYASVEVGKPIETLTTPDVPEDLGTSVGWGEFANGFFIGGSGGVIFAYLLCQALYFDLIQKILG
ncbi:photosystem I reaction centre subunit XI PsaL [Crocosphaera subtropica ATCC 51142]|uniref:Photosystem I reaction center subunit XI n=1 Tax=Crocosphaera subtropica (strain ATCC 51142 / BH68) TaxID=43989 RepID=PSAL_CROS5|nr:photosystem I reaction center subunit XI [Crocosphaera subtropica]B1WPZ7.1 RecName: Full=Photosystem I reaction center subunit XI; AltName: Full=PSI subunit V; AltName: Full=PSI-L [Crocosphaera subtropica ATCC 51142]ACB53312.1 photosystem I reaction centre subunit XI PsaL [Crocosphaera subtropica ATCC 51142]